MSRKNFTLFFGPHNPNGEFSNWYMRDFKWAGNTFNCVEQFMMYMKAMLFFDLKSAQAIMDAPHPKQQKAIGRTVAGFNEERWLQHREQIVGLGIDLKFSQNEDLLELLLENAGTTFVEASPYDRIYGAGLGADHPDIFTPSKWRGQNILGGLMTDLANRKLDQGVRNTLIKNQINQEEEQNKPFSDTSIQPQPAKLRRPLVRRVIKSPTP